MSQRIFSAFLALLLAMSLSVVSEAQQSKIVVVLPLSGKLANIGKDLQNAILLQNQKSVSIVFEDDVFDPKNTVSVVQKSLRDPAVKGFITFSSGTSLAAKPLIERAKIPALAVAMSDRLVEEGGSMFRYYVTVTSQAEFIAGQIAKRGYKNPAFIVSQQEAMLSFQDHFQRTLPYPENRYVEVQPGDVDLKSLALKVSTMNPDALCLLLLPPELPAFARQVRAIGYRGDFFGPTQIGNPDAARAAEQALENTWFTGVDETSARGMIERYRKAYGQSPTSEGIAAFDAAGLLVAAVESNDAIGYLRRFDYLGVFGNQLAIVHPNTFQPPLALKRIRGVSMEQAS